MVETKPLSNKEFEDDKELEKSIWEVQEQLGILGSILNDYIYMDSSSTSHICLVKRKKNVFFNVLTVSINNLEKTISSISKLLCKKEYTSRHLASKVFEVKLLYEDYFKCNTQVLLGSIKRQKEKILGHRNVHLYKRNELLMGHCIYLHEMSFDISKFFDDMYCWKMSRYKELISKNMITEDQVLFACVYRQRAYKRTMFSARDILGASQQITSRFIYKDDISIVPVAIFQLRQAIEIRLLEILGIGRIEKDDGTPEKITANSFLDIPDLQKYIIFPIDISILKKIYTWTNVFVHLGICGNYWLLEFAQKYLSNFILYNAVILKSYYDSLSEKISEFTRCDIRNIVWRKNADIDVIEDEVEFKRIRDLIDKKGYEAYKKENDDRFNEYMKKMSNRI